MPHINYAVMDVLKPHHPSVIEFGEELLKLGKDLSVNLRIVEMDEKTESIQLIIKGNGVKLEKIKETIEKLGGSIHSIDEVSMGKEVINSKDFIRIS